MNDVRTRPPTAGDVSDVSPSRKKVHLILGLMTFALGTSLGCGPKAGSSDGGSFLMDVGGPLTTETAVTSTRPLDSGASFRLGYGYDKLSGERRRSCLDKANYELIGRNVRSTVSSFEIVNTKEDLAKKLNIEVNAEASGSYGTITGSASTKTTILKNSNFNERSIVGIMNFSHKAQEIGIESDYQPLSADKLGLLKSNKEMFRLNCGDSYTKSVTTGAAMYLLVNLSSKGQEITNKVETVNTVKAAFGSMFSASTTTSVSNETVQTLSNFNISVSCHSVGVDTEACAQALTTVDPNDLASFVSYINSAKKALSDSINEQPDMLVAIDEVFEEYPKPIESLSAPRSEIFFDYAPQAAVLKDLLEKENQVNYICNVQLLSSCIDLRYAFSEQIRHCARQGSWADCKPESIDIQKLLSEGNMRTGIGKVIFWEHQKNGVANGKTLTMDFDKPSTDPNAFVEGRIYNFTAIGYNDIATGFQSSLRAGWQLRVFEHPDGGGRCYMVGGPSAQPINLGWFNDKASSARLEKVGAYPTSCN